MEEIWDDYFQYLIWRCGLERVIRLDQLFLTLHNINFTYLLERDDNREEDGRDLREEYGRGAYFGGRELEEAFYGREVSVLEVLIGLSIRVDNEIIGDPAEEHPEDFFMEMIENLGLDKFRNHTCCEHDVIKIVNRWMNRRFERDGTGSPFPVKYDHRDQRKLEIWDQMNAYISENYY